MDRNPELRIGDETGEASQSADVVEITMARHYDIETANAPVGEPASKQRRLGSSIHEHGGAVRSAKQGGVALSHVEKRGGRHLRPHRCPRSEANGNDQDRRHRDESQTAVLQEEPEAGSTERPRPSHLWPCGGD